jgi:hypothetical protein
VRHLIDRSALAVLALLAVAAADASAGSITYNIVNMPDFQNGNTVGGTITTDGTIGDVSSHISAWSVDINGSPAFSSTGLSTSLFFGLMATATELYLPIGANEVILNGYDPVSLRLEFTLGWLVEQNFGNPRFEYAFQVGIDQGPLISFPPVLGSNWVIASVPEPSTLTMLAIASVCVTAYSRRIV